MVWNKKCTLELIIVVSLILKFKNIMYYLIKINIVK